MRAGQLELVLWDHMGECVGPAHMRCWQPLVYSHALLEAWGGGTRLLISDIDEYFVLPTANTSLAGALQGCTGGSKAMARSHLATALAVVFSFPIAPGTVPLWCEFAVLPL